MGKPFVINQSGNEISQIIIPTIYYWLRQCDCFNSKEWRQKKDNRMHSLLQTIR